jgi:hypothetical protein
MSQTGSCFHAEFWEPAGERRAALLSNTDFRVNWRAHHASHDASRRLRGVNGIT